MAKKVVYEPAAKPREEYVQSLYPCIGGTKVCPKRERGECKHTGKIEVRG